MWKGTGCQLLGSFQSYISYSLSSELILLLSYLNSPHISLGRIKASKSFLFRILLARILFLKSSHVAVLFVLFNPILPSKAFLILIFSYTPTYLNIFFSVSIFLTHKALLLTPHFSLHQMSLNFHLLDIITFFQKMYVYHMPLFSNIISFTAALVHSFSHFSIYNF